MAIKFRTDGNPIEVKPSKEIKSMDKYIVWHIEGGLGKNVAATALLPALAKKHQDRKIIVVASYPEIFLNSPHIYRVYAVGNSPYFYDDYIYQKDTIVFKHEPYFQTQHILKKKHVIQNWADLLELEVKNPKPQLYPNMVQKNFKHTWNREKPVLLIQTAGGLFSGQTMGYSWTRDMPLEYANWIIGEYSKDYHVIQITREGAPALQGAEVINQPMTNLELFSLIEASSKRILIDSSLQHAAAAYGKKSVVLWVGTAPENFGYDMHTNIKAQPPKGNTKLIDAYFFDADFTGRPHECPYEDVNEMFNLEQLKKAINKTN